MTSHEIPSEIREFVIRNLHSVTALEILLFLRNEAPRGLSLSQLVRELRSSDSQVSQVVAQLSSTGLIQASDGDPRLYSLAAISPDQKVTLDLLAQIAVQRRTTLIELIYQAPLEKIRTFADAFKWRKN